MGKAAPDDLLIAKFWNLDLLFSSLKRSAPGADISVQRAHRCSRVSSSKGCPQVKLWIAFRDQALLALGIPLIEAN